MAVAESGFEYTTRPRYMLAGFAESKPVWKDISPRASGRQT